MFCLLLAWDVAKASAVRGNRFPFRVVLLWSVVSRRVTVVTSSLRFMKYIAKISFARRLYSIHTHNHTGVCTH